MDKAEMIFYCCLIVLVGLAIFGGYHMSTMSEEEVCLREIAEKYCIEQGGEFKTKGVVNILSYSFDCWIDRQKELFYFTEEEKEYCRGIE